MTSSIFTRLFLNDLRQKALRKNVWYKSLDRLERGIFSLTTHLIDQVKSAVLGVELVKIIKKLRDAMKSEFFKYIEVFGLKKARYVAGKAVDLGYSAAAVWASDVDFIRYLAFLKVNEISGWPV